MANVEWIGAISALSAGTVGGALVAWRAATKPPAAPKKDRGTLYGFLGGVGAVAVIVAVVYFVTRPQINIEEHIGLARQALLQNDLPKVFAETELVLGRDPDNPRALSYQALVRLSMGERGEAESMLRRALAKDPDLLDAWLHLAIVHSQSGRLDSAKNALDEAARRHPEERAMLDQLWREMNGT
jgi:tetratricopeptide (TPR) repeat protein